MVNNKSSSDSISTLSEVVDVPPEVIGASRNDDLVLFIGAGVSRLLGLPSWQELAEKVLKDMRKGGVLNYFEIDQLKNLDPRKQLSIAKQIANQDIYSSSIEQHLSNTTGGDNIYRVIKDIECSYVTTNYDEFLLPRSESISSKPIAEKTEFSVGLLDNPGAVVHLHGCISKPDTMVVTTKDYLEHYSDKQLQYFLKEMFDKKVVVFLGYGLEELEILEYILNRGQAKDTKEKKRFTVQGFFSSQKFLYEKLYKYYRETFGVHLLSFARDEKGYQGLEEVLRIWKSQIRPTLLNDVEFMERVLGNEDVSVEEEDELLERVRKKKELRLLFLQKVKGLKWFGRLDEEGYFSADKLPLLKQVQEERYFTIPYWEVSGYLLRTAEELSEPSVIAYASRFLEIIDQVTTYAKNNGITNYHVWRHFAEILSQIPAQRIEAKYLDVVDYWLDTDFSNSLVATVIGLKWLPKLLESDDAHSLELAYRLLEILFKISFPAKDTGGYWDKANLRFRHYWAEKIVKEVAYMAGCLLKEKAVSLLQSRLAEVLNKLKIDTWSYSWCQAVRDYKPIAIDRAEGILLTAYRDALSGYMAQCPNKACNFIQELFDDPNQCQTVVRVAIHCVGEKFQHCQVITEKLIDDKYFENNYRREFWHFLKQNYSSFTDSQKEATLKIIQKQIRTDKNGNVIDSTSAYERAIWLLAIQSSGKKELALYEEAVNIAGTKPDHPKSTYSESDSIFEKSPYSVKELSALSSSELFKKLADHKDKKSWQGSSIEGLTNTIKQLFKKEPLKYYDCLADFENLDLAYIYSIIKAYSELWQDKANLPWDELWKHILNFIQKIVARDQFWDSKNAGPRQAFIANRYDVVGSIAGFLESGAKSDDHAYPAEYHDVVRDILKVLLDKEEGSKDFDATSDAVSISLNNPRGKCIKALINLFLRECKIERKANNGDHSVIWKKYRGYFESEFGRAEKEEFEFATLVTMYLPKFLYLEKQWVLDKLPIIFDQEQPLKWSCAMQGYAYVVTIYPEIYYYLRDHGDFLHALNVYAISDVTARSRVQEKVIENIVIAYLNDFETFEEENSLINVLLTRFQSSVMYLIWFIWTCCKKGDERLRTKIYELWSLLIDKVDVSKAEDRKLASQLCDWASFIEHIDEERMNWLRKIAPYAEENDNSYLLLENIARLSKKQPLEANEIWQAMLERSVPAYPEEAMREILKNLVDESDLGKRVAKETVNIYLKKGFRVPFDLLQEISSTKTPESGNKSH